MFYVLENSAITLTDKESYNIYQEKNPQTQEYFESPEEALAWGEQYVCMTFGIMPDSFAQFTLEIRNSSKQIVDELILDNRFKLTLTESTGLFNEDIDIGIYHEETKSTTDVAFSFVDGVATATFTPKRVGTYIVLPNGVLSIGGEEKVVFDNIEKFTTNCV